MTPDEWMPVERNRPEFRYTEQQNLNDEMRRLVMLTKENQYRREAAEKRLRARLEGYVPIDEAMARADAEREASNGHRTYPREWAEIAARTEQIKREQRDKRKRTRRAGHYDKSPE